jgi:hypothetical protein
MASQSDHPQFDCESPVGVVFTATAVNLEHRVKWEAAYFISIQTGGATDRNDEIDSFPQFIVAILDLPTSRVTG